MGLLKVGSSPSAVWIATVTALSVELVIRQTASPIVIRSATEEYTVLASGTATLSGLGAIPLVIVVLLPVCRHRDAVIHRQHMSHRDHRAGTPISPPTKTIVSVLPAPGA